MKIGCLACLNEKPYYDGRVWLWAMCYHESGWSTGLRQLAATLAMFHPLPAADA